VLKAHPPAATGVLIYSGKAITPHIAKLSEAGIPPIVRLGVSSSSCRLQSVFTGSTGDEKARFVARTVESARELLADA